jgi:8-oxo-dGTP pyrophosphatase MutT (NUDIX family)
VTVQPVNAHWAEMIRSKLSVRRRVQYAALPYRWDGRSAVEVLLITSRETGRWIIPKGWPLKGKRPHRTAAREAQEEAGVTGKINRRPIGSFPYRKRLKSGKVVLCEVQVFALRVTGQRARWTEKGERKVKWMPRAKAATTVKNSVLRTIIRSIPSAPGRRPPKTSDSR